MKAGGAPSSKAGLSDAEAAAARWNRCTVAVIYFLVATYIMCLGNEISDRRRPTTPILPDLLFDYIPAFEPENANLTDYMVAIHVVSLFFLAAVSNQRQRLSRRFVTLYGTLEILRGLTIVVTGLPDPSPRCAFAEVLEDRPNIWMRALRMMLPVGVVTCGDMIFSGHATLMVLVALTWIYYGHTVRLPYLMRADAKPPCAAERRQTQRMLKWFWGLLTSFSLFTIIPTRLHYTIDVVLGVYLTVRLWFSYHQIAFIPALRAKVPIVAWLEEGTVQYSSVGSGVMDNDDMVTNVTAPVGVMSPTPIPSTSALEGSAPQGKSSTSVPSVPPAKFAGGRKRSGEVR